MNYSTQLTQWNTPNNRHDLIALMLMECDADGNYRYDLDTASAIADTLRDDVTDLYGMDDTQHEAYMNAAATADVDDVIYDVLGSARWRPVAQDIRHHTPECYCDASMDIGDGSGEALEWAAGEIWVSDGRATDGERVSNLLDPWSFKQHEEKRTNERRYHGIKELIFNTKGERRSLTRAKAISAASKRRKTLLTKKPASQKRLERLQKRFGVK